MQPRSLFNISDTLAEEMNEFVSFCTRFALSFDKIATSQQSSSKLALLSVYIIFVAESSRAEL